MVGLDGFAVYYKFSFAARGLDLGSVMLLLVHIGIIMMIVVACVVMWLCFVYEGTRRKYNHGWYVCNIASNLLNTYWESAVCVLLYANQHFDTNRIGKPRAVLGARGCR